MSESSLTKKETTKMHTCHSCGNRIVLDAKTCPFCEKKEQEKKVLNHKKNLSIVFFAFAAICFITMFAFNWNSGPELKQVLPSNGGIVGPININRNNLVCNIKVIQDMYGDNWSSIDGSVLDNNKNYLFGFGKDIWQESGMDSQGYSWAEKDDKYDMKVNFIKKGIYYLQFEAQQESTQNAGYMSIIVSPQKGSSLPQVIFGIICLLFGLYFGGMYWHKKDKTETEREMLGNVLMYVGIALFVWLCIVFDIDLD